MSFSAALSGFAMSGGLIMAIGAQNAFVLRQGIKGEHILAVVLLCMVSDIFCITLGVVGVGGLIGSLFNLLRSYGNQARASREWLTHGARQFRNAREFLKGGHLNVPRFHLSEP